MENQNTPNQVVMSIPQAINYVQDKLGNIPYTVKENSTIGAPLSECIVLLEQIKQLLVAQEQKAENNQNVTERPAAKKETGSPCFAEE